MNNQNHKEHDEKILHIGFDDTDSTNGRCTTHLAYLITNVLIKKYKVNFIDFPLLIRLNPNIPLKTRGNGAVCLRIKARKYEKIKEEILHFIENYSDLEKGANPGLAFYEENNIASDVISLSTNAMERVLRKKLAKKIARKKNNDWYAGAINNHEARQLNISFNLLGEGKYDAEIYTDADDANENPNHLIMQKKVVTKEDKLSVHLTSGGGVVIHLKKTIN